MNWLTIIMEIVRIIFSRAFNEDKAQALNFSECSNVKKLARQMVQVQPQLNYDCLVKILPGLLSDIGKLALGGRLDITSIINVALVHVSALLRCQFNITQAEAAKSGLDSAILKAALAAVIYYLQTKDLAGAITKFFESLFGSEEPTPPGDGGNGDNGNGDTPNPPGDGGDDGTTPIGPEIPVFRNVQRCS